MDLATIIAGPYACQLLGDFGADVVKVEHPRGDGLRGHGPQMNGVGLWWKSVSRNKSAIALDLSNSQGAEILLRLATEADVVVESFRPGTMERWGIGWEQLSAVNPRLIMLRVSGFGQTGPYRDRPGFGTLAEAMSGYAAMSGEPGGDPLLPPFGLADGVTGLAGAMAVLAALYHRDARGGSGQVIDLSILEPLVSVLGSQATAYASLGVIPERAGNQSRNNAPRNVYKTKDDQWVAVSSSATNVAVRVMTLVGRADLTRQPWFSTGGGRAEHATQIDRAVADWIIQRTREEVLASFETAQAAAAPVYDIAQLMEDPQIIDREVFRTMPDSELGEVVLQDPCVRLSATPATIRWTGRPLGADTRSILRDIADVDAEQFEQLRRDGVVA